MEKQKVYIETSVISYLTAKPSRDLVTAGHQKTTYDWWHKSKHKFDCYISDFVTQEVMQGDKEAAALRLDVIENLDILVVNNEISELADIYFQLLSIPYKSKIDAYHLAFTVWYNIDFLITWNCKHIANAINIQKINSYNAVNKIWIPVFCTPQELMEV
ncbi:MAG: type II toxin-antitoxin system VapC family toxin [bacterium]